MDDFLVRRFLMMKADGHIHTPFCPHGTDDSFEAYIEQAINLGFTEISFTEHAPLPQGFNDPTPSQDCGMKFELFDEYVRAIDDMKKKYKSEIKINIGLEVDFIIGYEKESMALLNQIGPMLDDSILSVHFLRYNDTYYCMDYSEQEFAKMIDVFGSLEALYRSYFEIVLMSVKSDLGPYKPRRIGHMTLVRKFQKSFPCEETFDNEIDTLLHEIKRRNLQLDYNGAGLKKPLCGEPYPTNQVIQKATQKKIPLIYGSDAHTFKGLGQGYSTLSENGKLLSPSRS